MKIRYAMLFTAALALASLPLSAIPVTIDEDWTITQAAVEANGNDAAIVGGINAGTEQFDWARVSKTGSSLGDLDTRSWSDLTGTPTTLLGYGIADAYTKVESVPIFPGLATFKAALNALDSGVGGHLTFAVAGDSLGPRLAGKWAEYLAARYGWAGAALLMVDSTNSSLAGLTTPSDQAHGLGYTLSGDAVVVTNGYSVWPTGYYYTLETGSILVSDISGSGTPYRASRLAVYYVAETGAGRFTVESSTNGTDWTVESTVDADNGGSAEGRIETIDKVTTDDYFIRITGLDTGDPVKIIGAGMFDDNRSGVVLVGIHKPSLDLVNEVSANENIFLPIYQSLAPDIITSQYNDGDNLFELYIETLYARWTSHDVSNAAPSVAIIINHGSAPVGDGYVWETGYDPTTWWDWTYGWLRTNGIWYCDLSTSLIPRRGEYLTRAAWYGDGVHFSDYYYAWAADASYGQLVNALVPAPLPSVDDYLAGLEYSTPIDRAKMLELYKYPNLEGQSPAGRLYVEPSGGYNIRLDLTSDFDTQRRFEVRAMAGETPTTLLRLTENEGVNLNFIANFCVGAVDGPRLSNNNGLLNVNSQPIGYAARGSAVNPASGDTINMDTLGRSRNFLLNSTTTLAALTLQLPAEANANNGDELLFFTRADITAVTLAANGNTVYGASLTTMSAGSYVIYRKIYNSTWLRLN